MGGFKGKDMFAGILSDNIVRDGAKIVLSVSGGIDSMVMLYLFADIVGCMDIDIVVFHFDHKIRDASSLDLQFVEKEADKFGFGFYSESFDVLSYAEREKLSVEDAARKLRYSALKKLCLDIKADFASIAHNKNDQAETVLMRMLRGCGIKGLSAMRKISIYEGILIYRPLLYFPRSEICEYACKFKVPYREDYTNSKSVYLRNKIRLELLPLLRKYNSAVDDMLCNLSDIAYMDNLFIDNAALHKYREVVLPLNGAYVMEKSDFLRLQPAIAYRIVRKILHKLGISELTYDAWKSICNLAESGNKLLLGKSVAVASRYEKVYFYKAEKKKYYYELYPDEELLVREAGIRISARFLKKSEIEFSEDKNCEYFDADKVVFPLVVRNRKIGDGIFPLGMSKRKRVKKILIDKKVPFFMRDRVPVLESAGDLLWVIPYVISEKFKVDANTENVLEVRNKHM